MNELFERIASLTDVEGITISGGEPLQQPEGVLSLLEMIRSKLLLSSVLFTGLYPKEIKEKGLYSRLSKCLDVLIAGRYEMDQHVGYGLLGSANKQIEFFSSRYCKSDFDEIPIAELFLMPDGEVISTGIDPVRVSQ